MDITGVSYDEVVRAVAKASAKYDGNITVHQDAKPIRNGFRGRLIGITTGGPGTRTSVSGRRGKYVCWHAYRDAMYEIFDINPDARIRTALATYKGLKGFEDEYPATGNRNMGNMMQHITMPDLCDC